MQTIDCNTVNNYIDEYTCKGTIQKHIGNEILLVVNDFNRSLKKVKSTLVDKGYCVTLAENKQVLNSSIFKNNNLIYVDCSVNFNLLDCVIRKKNSKILVIAIMNDGCKTKECVFAKHAYDYITTSISSIELTNKTCLYMLYSAACKLNIFDDKSSHQFNNESQDREIMLVNDACHYLLNNMPNYKSLDQLCRLLGTNRNTLAIAFKKQKGMGAYTWLRNARIFKATKLLKFSNINIQSICFEVGYENAANFSTTFKSITGLCPKEYRKLHNQNFK
jgi:AraC-like DNA-binding protein